MRSITLCHSPRVSDFLIRMRLAHKVARAAQTAGACTEIHRRPGGQLVVECGVETSHEKRFFEIFIESDGLLSLIFFREGQIVEVTGLSMPP